MAGNSFQFNVTSSDFARVAAALREIDRKLPGRLREELRKSAQPMAAQARRNAREIPASGRSDKRLRARMARAVRVQARSSERAGVSVVVSSPDRDLITVARYLDGTDGWRHPVFGDRHIWVHESSHPWFMEVLREGRDETTNRIHRALEELANEVHRAGDPL